jgi:hypothetical protein
MKDMIDYVKKNNYLAISSKADNSLTPDGANFKYN